MNNLQKIRLLCLIGSLAFYYWLYFECGVNVASHDTIAFSFLIHSFAFMYSLTFFQYLRIPFVSILSVLNILGFAIAPANVDFNIFQLGVFNPEMFFHINLGYILFYSSHFVFLHFQIQKNQKLGQFIIENRLKGDGSKQLVVIQNYSLVFFIISKIISLPISGLSEIFELYTIGSLLIGFFKGTNSFIKNLLTVVLVILTTMQIVLSGLIYPIIFFGFFISALMLQYGLKSIVSKLFLILGILFIIIFTILFNPVKMEFRKEDMSGKSKFDKLGIIYKLMLDGNKTTAEIEVENTTLWRLTYPMSAISMVNEKTPSKVPYWNGESYYTLLYKFIPRFLWKDKPSEDLGQVFGHKYEVLDKWDLITSMNTPILAEGYMNFGWLGYYGVHILIAFIMARVIISSNLKSSKSQGTIKYLLNSLNLSIVLSFIIQWESNLSLLLGNLLILVMINFLIDWLFFRKQDSDDLIPHIRLATT